MSTSNKRKQHLSSSDLPSKRAKKPGKEDVKSTENEQHREFNTVSASLVISIPPLFANNTKEGVEEMLDSMVMRYIPALQGIVLSHSNLRFVEETASIRADCPFLVCRIIFDATMWSPRVGMKLVGKINLSSPDHISLLVHKTFNVSLPRHHIPTEDWEFEYGPAENDPEFGGDAQNEMNQDPAEANNEEEEKAQGTGGRWVRKLTGQRIGDSQGFLQFTVIGLTVANEMLSLLGSIQPDPFSPRHKPNVRTPPSSEAETNTVHTDGANEEESGEEEDTFHTLGQMVETKLKRGGKEIRNDDEGPPIKRRQK